ncbi:hypothetical protein B0G81_2371 [Paraburkholderia sp. BL6665CI2N2]|uniref:hypothetical protein n=1 Tax=Paraburkholderia sp. BL6665CI2N2 TaxID=1938806 RepID=UPI001064B477|nr:hypothetical protein [Paraburkholderia sp. BL6665CI2N2]TDY22089.1 hypothetical protein B0G81_2371 [Paraburkholderia sp. BL6665CI2N2]
MDLSELELEKSREEARAAYLTMKSSKASMRDRGLFFKTMLAKGLWINQSTLASGIGESITQVSRCLKASRIPAAVVQAFGNRRLSDRAVKLIGEISEQIGEPKLIENAERLEIRNDLSVRELLSALFLGSHVDDPSNGEARLAAYRNEPYVRLYAADLMELRKNLRTIEKHLRLIMKLQKVTPAS